MVVSGIDRINQPGVVDGTILCVCASQGRVNVPMQDLSTYDFSFPLFFSAHSIPTRSPLA